MRTGLSFRRRVAPHVLVAALCALYGARPGVSAPAGQPAAADAATIADFEEGLPEGWGYSRARASLTPDGSRGQGLRVELEPENRAAAVISIPLGKSDLARHDGFELAARAASDQPEVRLRWIALDAAGRPLHQRRHTLKPGDAWAPVRLPLVEWRWGNASTGPWSEAKRLVLLVESPARELWLDEIRLASAADDESPAGWLKRQAFDGAGAGTTRFAEADGMLVGTDAAGQLTDEHLRRMLSNMQKARKWVRRVFGPAVRPLDGEVTPPALLIFRDGDGYRAFWQRIGRAWDAQIAPPTSGGYTVQSISTSTYDPKIGPDRPVYLHESVHAVVAHELRLVTGTEQHGWLHEGIAAYLQLCLYPKSLDPAAYRRGFTTPIGREGGLFQPLDRLIVGRPSPAYYAQLASLVAYLAEEKPDWLATIAKSLADGETPGQALKRCGTNVGELQEAWLAWGKRRYVANEPDRHFEPPLEWRD